MAERRMFAKTIIDSDAFLDMPVTARLLYYDLSMRADDDGFVNSPKKIMRMVGASPDDLSILGLRKFIIPFESGVVVIKHWKIHNYIRKDTYNETKYKEEKALLDLDENNAYRQRAVDGSWTQDRLGKDRIGQDSIGEDIEPPAAIPHPPRYGLHGEIALVDPSTVNDKQLGQLADSVGLTFDQYRDAWELEEDYHKLKQEVRQTKPVRHKYGEYNNVLLTDEDLDKLKAEFPDWQARIERLSSYMASTGKSYKNHLATIRNWARKDSESPKQEQRGGNVFLEMLNEERGV